MHMQMLRPGFAHVEGKSAVGKYCQVLHLGQSQSRNPINQQQRRTQIEPNKPSKPIANRFLFPYLLFPSRFALTSCRRRCHQGISRSLHLRIRLECELFYKLNSFFAPASEVRIQPYTGRSGDGSSCLLASVPFTFF